MSNKIEAARARAEAGFKPYDGSAAGPMLTEEQLAQQMVQERTARLKAMRLAKEKTEEIGASVRNKRRAK